jgi:hypothetical protein
MAATSMADNISPELLKVMERAKDPNFVFLSLAHLIDEAALTRAFNRIRKDAAVGVDGITKEQYGQELESHVRDLHERLRAMRWRHQPIRRVHIPKEKGKSRPIGISSVEDKIVQEALREILDALYEPIFCDFSYGFRRRRSAHDALRALNQVLYRGEGMWILELDVQSYFDRINRKLLLEMLRERVVDGSLLRLIGKCLHVGVLDGEEYFEPEEGTAQGSVVTPPTQMTTLVAGDSVRGFVAGGRACRRGYSIDDRRTILVEFHARNERADQLTAVLPVKAVESIADLIRELAQPTNHGGQLDSLPESRFSVIEFLARPLDAGANAIASRHEVFKIDRARLVRIPQAAERVLLGHEQPLGLIPLRAQLRDCPVLSSALRPFLEHTRRIFHHVKNGFPHIAIELLGLIRRSHWNDATPRRS